MAQAEQLADKIIATIASQFGNLSEISDSDASHKPENKWSAKELIGHLIDSAFYNHIRFTRGTLEDRLNFDGYPQVELVELQNYNSRSWQELLSFWREINIHVAEGVRCISDDQLTKPKAEHSLDKIAMKRIAGDEPATLFYLIEDYIAHMELHLEQLYGRLPNS